MVISGASAAEDVRVGIVPDAAHTFAADNPPRGGPTGSPVSVALDEWLTTSSDGWPGTRCALAATRRLCKVRTRDDVADGPVIEFVVQREAFDPLLRLQRCGNRRVETLAHDDALVEDDSSIGNVPRTVGPPIETYEDKLELVAGGSAIAVLPVGDRRSSLRPDLVTIPIKHAPHTRVVLVSRKEDPNR